MATEYSDPQKVATFPPHATNAFHRDIPPTNPSSSNNEFSIKMILTTTKSGYSLHKHTEIIMICGLGYLAKRIAFFEGVSLCAAYGIRLRHNTQRSLKDPPRSE